MFSFEIADDLAHWQAESFRAISKLKSTPP
jgi:hypothetical protein